MNKPRRKHSPADKAAIVRRHLADKVPVSTLAEELGLQPSQIHLWIKQVLDQADAAFQRTSRHR
jgi:transposase-like protein